MGKEVVVTTEKEDNNVTSLSSGMATLSSIEIKQLPLFLGESDAIKSIQLMPGISSVSEGNSGIYVRGGGPGQNNILLDHMPVYNPSHLLGLFSVFNTSVIDNVHLIKGGSPANYGGKLSSVLEVNMKETIEKKPHLEASIGMISSSLTTSVPLIKDRVSLMVSARNTYLKLLQKTVMSPFFDNVNSTFKNTEYGFYDLYGKLIIKPTKKDYLIFSGYTGNDNYTLNKKNINFTNNMTWGNLAYSGKWKHIFDSQFSIANQIGYSGYKFDLNSGFEDFTFTLFSDIKDVFYKTDLNYFGINKHRIKLGGEYISHTLTPNKIYAQAKQLNFNVYQQYYSNEYSFYYNDEVYISKEFSANLGIRFNHFNHIGPFTEYEKDIIGNIVREVSYSKNQKIKGFSSIEPRVMFTYILSDEASVKASYTFNSQNIHLLSIGSVSLPMDIWIPSTYFIAPEKAHQVSLGYFRNFKQNTYETYGELYFKKLNNQIELKTGILNNLDETVIEEGITEGEGLAAGAEFYIEKKKGNPLFRISYTLSKTIRYFGELNNGGYFPAKYDRPHDFTGFINYTLNEKWSFSSVFVFASGTNMTLPEGRYMIQKFIVNDYGKTNGYRMSPYHRLDISATYTPKKTEKFESSWNFSVYNVYNRANPYYILFEASGNLEEYNLKVSAQKISLFPIMPSVSYRIKF